MSRAVRVAVMRAPELLASILAAADGVEPLPSLAASDAALGGWSRPSKMVGLSWGWSRDSCATLQRGPGPDDVCADCYASRGRAALPVPQSALARRLAVVRQASVALRAGDPRPAARVAHALAVGVRRGGWIRYGWCGDPDHRDPAAHVALGVAGYLLGVSQALQLGTSPAAVWWSIRDGAAVRAWSEVAEDLGSAVDGLVVRVSLRRIDPAPRSVAAAVRVGLPVAVVATSPPSAVASAYTDAHLCPATWSGAHSCQAAGCRSCWQASAPVVVYRRHR